MTTLTTMTMTTTTMIKRTILAVCLLTLATSTVAALSSAGAASGVPLSKVLVTGAAGRTGQLVFGALLRDARFETKALVRSAASGKKLRKSFDPSVGLDQIVVCDVASMAGDDTPAKGLEGYQAMVICTSAVPALSKWSLFKAVLKVPVNVIRRKKAFDFRSLSFVWKKGQYPEMVDYQGTIAQIELAKKVGMQHVVVVGSMGGTDPTNFLNTIGKKKDGTGNGDILLWKRKAERYLVESGLDYTIVSPTKPTNQTIFLEMETRTLAHSPCLAHAR